MKIYPGADEVGLSMLSRMTVDSVSKLNRATDCTASGAGALVTGGTEQPSQNAAIDGAAVGLDAPVNDLSSASPTGMSEYGTLSALSPPVLTLVFRDPTNTSLYLIPNYEGQPMIFTLLDQIAAAGGVPSSNNWTVTAAIQHYCSGMFCVHKLGFSRAIARGLVGRLPVVCVCVGRACFASHPSTSNFQLVGSP